MSEIRKWLEAIANGQKIDTRGAGVPLILECQIASYDRSPSGQRFENLRVSSVKLDPVVR